MNLAHTKSDYIGSIASGLCAIHCAVTPLLFVAQSCSSAGCCEASPAWWSAIDYLFIGITLLAVYFSAGNTSKNWMKYALWGSWALLTFLIINEKAGAWPLAEGWKYFSAFALISLHVYNKRYCQCATDCCETAQGNAANNLEQPIV